MAMKRGERKRERRLQTMSSSSVASTAEEATAALVVCQSVQQSVSSLLISSSRPFSFIGESSLLLSQSAFSVWQKQARALPVQALSFFLSLPVLLSGLPHCSFPPPPTFFFWLPCELCTRILSCPRPLLSPKNILSKNNSK